MIQSWLWLMLITTISEALNQGNNNPSETIVKTVKNLFKNTNLQLTKIGILFVKLFRAIGEDEVRVKSLVVELVPLDGWTDLRTEHDVFNIAITRPGGPPGPCLCSPSGHQEQTGSKSEPRVRSWHPIWGRWTGGGQWSEHYTSHVTLSTGQTFSGNFILMKSSHPEQISKSAHYPRFPSNTSIYPHTRDLCLLIIFPRGFYFYFSTATLWNLYQNIRTAEILSRNDSNACSLAQL